MDNLTLLTVSGFHVQEVLVNAYSSEEYAAAECKQCSATSAVVLLYDTVDKYNEHFHAQMKQSYSVIVIAVFATSTTDSVCNFMESVRLYADNLPDDVVANGVVINVRRFFPPEKSVFVAGMLTRPGVSRPKA